MSRRMKLNLNFIKYNKNIVNNKINRIKQNKKNGKYIAMNEVFFNFCKMNQVIIRKIFM